MIIRRCVPETKQGGIMKNVMHHHMEDTLRKQNSPENSLIGFLLAYSIQRMF